MSRRCRTYPLCDPQGCTSDLCPVGGAEFPGYEGELDVDEAVLADQDERHEQDDRA